MKKWKSAIIKIGCSICILSSATFLAGSDHASGATTISANITTNTIWRPEGSPYIVTSTVYVRALNASDPAPTLTITPQKADGTYGAVVVKFHPNASLAIGAFDTFSRWYGALDAQGTSQYPITFTANSPPPDPYTIPPNPQSYYWGNVLFDKASDYNKTKLKYCTFEYGGYYTSGTGKGNITINNNTLFRAANPIEQCIFRYSYTDGIVLANSSGDLKDCQVAWNQRHGIYCQDNSGGLLQHNDLSHNKQCGLYCKTTTVSLTINSNTFSENGSYPLTIPPAAFDGQNSYTNNINQNILILGCQISNTGTYTFPHEGIPYRIKGTSPATYAGLLFLADQSEENIAVTIEPGVTMQFEENTTFSIDSVSGAQATLNASGTENNQITFTTATSGKYWKGLFLRTASPTTPASTLEYCTIEYAGASRSGFTETGNIYCENSLPVLRNCTSQQSVSHGLYLKGPMSSQPKAIIDHCTIQHNNGSGLYFYQTAGGVLTNNAISNNSQYGIYANNITHSLLTINSNTFAGNGLNPLCIPPAVFDGQNSYVNNGEQTIKILGCQIKDTANVTFPHEGIPYRITGNSPATYSGLNFLADQSGENIAVTINPGVTMLFETATSLRFGSVSGSQCKLMAVGTKDKPITFTTSEPGQYWDTVYFNSNYINQSAWDSRLSYCIIEYAGNQGTSNAAAVYFYNGFPSEQTLKNTTIRFSETNGIKIFKQNGGTTAINNNNLYGNALYDVLDYYNSLTINAERNYWGTPHGPSQDLCSSAVVSDTVLFEAWLEQEFTDPFRFTAASANPKQFNPLTQSTTFSFTLSQSATWTLSVLNEQFEKLWSTAGTGSSAAITWNGVGDNGVVSGTCYYRIEAQTGSTKASSAMGILKVSDQTIARITHPTSGSLFTPGTPITIAGTAQVGIGGYYDVQYGAGEEPSSWTTIAGPIYASRQNEELASWNTAGLDQPIYTINLNVRKSGIIYTDVARVKLYLEEQLPSADSAALYTYDALGRLIKVVYPDESWISYTYDRVGNRKKVEHSGRNSLPTAIKLSSFSATPRLKGVIVRWETETEGNTAGFNLYRKSARENDYQKLNRALIASRGTAIEGAAYTYIDIPRKVGGHWYYMLEEVEHNGKTKRYGPVSSKNIALKRPNSMRAFRKSFKSHCDE